MDNGDILSDDDEKNDLMLRLQAETPLGDILNLHMQLNDACDKKANFILVFSGILLTILLTRLSDFIHLDIFYSCAMILFLFTLIALVFSVILSASVILPKIKNSKRSDNFFYYGSFCDNKIEQYEQKLKEIVKNPDELIKQYSNEIYDLGQYDLKPRFTYLIHATNMLILSWMSGTLTIIALII